MKSFDAAAAPGKYPEDRGASGQTKGPTEASSAEEVNSRINRILRIVQSPSLPKDTSGGDDGHQRNGNGAARGRDRKGGGRKPDTGGARTGSGGGGGGMRNGGGDGGDGPRRGRRGMGKNGGGDGGNSGGQDQKGSGGGKGYNTAPVYEDAASDEDAEASRAKLNPHAAIFVPTVVEAVEETTSYADTSWGAGYYDEQGTWVGDTAKDALGFPEVLMKGERDYIGLHQIAEMGEWVVLRENKPQCLPFFWNSETGFKTWEEPDSIKAAGIGELLKKWSVELPETGIAPGPEAWPEPLHHGQRRDRDRRHDAQPPVHTPVPPPPPVEVAKVHVAPPGFGGKPAASVAERSEKGAGRRRPQPAADRRGEDSAAPPGWGTSNLAARALHEATADEDRKGGRGSKSSGRGNTQAAKPKAASGAPKWKPKESSVPESAEAQSRSGHNDR